MLVISINFKIQRSRYHLPCKVVHDHRRFTIYVPYCKANEQQSCAFMKKIELCIRGFTILQSLGNNMKDQNIHLNHVVYQGTCTN